MELINNSEHPLNHCRPRRMFNSVKKDKEYYEVLQKREAAFIVLLLVLAAKVK